MVFEESSFRLAIHYHIPICVIGDTLCCPSYFGIWVDSLAKRFQEIVLISYTCEKCDADYPIQSSNVTIISLGNKPNSFLAHITNIPSVLRIIASSRDDFDGIGFRIPTFLAFYLYPLVRKKSVFFLLVGNMFRMLVISPTIWWKRWVLVGYWWMDLQLISWFGNRVQVFSIGEYFSREYPKIKRMENIFTSTISASDIVIEPRKRQHGLIDLIFVGRLSVEKGLDAALKALSCVDSSYGKLTILGAKEGEEYERLNKLCVQLRLEQRVAFIGYVPKGRIFYSYLDKSDVMIIPSLWDGQTRAIWEGMARGLPIIASRGIKSLPMQFKHKEEIYFVDPGNAEQLAEAIKELQCDPDLYSRLSRASIKIARERTVDKSADLLIEGLKKSEKFNII